MPRRRSPRTPSEIADQLDALLGREDVRKRLNALRSLSRLNGKKPLAKRERAKLERRSQKAEQRIEDIKAAIAGVRQGKAFKDACPEGVSHVELAQVASGRQELDFVSRWKNNNLRDRLEQRIEDMQPRLEHIRLLATQSEKYRKKHEKALGFLTLMNTALHMVKNGYMIDEAAPLIGKPADMFRNFAYDDPIPHPLRVHTQPGQGKKEKGAARKDIAKKRTHPDWGRAALTFCLYGSVPHNAYIFTSNDRATALRHAKHFEALTGQPVEVHDVTSKRKKRGKTKVMTSYKFKINDSGLLKELLAATDGRSRLDPDDFTHEQVDAMLKEFFDREGAVSSVVRHGKPHYTLISGDRKGKTLQTLKDIQKMLVERGIFANIIYGRRSNRLSITGPDIPRFAEQIGFSDPERNRALETAARAARRITRPGYSPDQYYGVRRYYDIHPTFGKATIAREFGVTPHAVADWCSEGRQKVPASVKVYESAYGPSPEEAERHWLELETKARSRAPAVNDKNLNPPLIRLNQTTAAIRYLESEKSTHEALIHETSDHGHIRRLKRHINGINGQLRHLRRLNDEAVGDRKAAAAMGVEIGTSKTKRKGSSKGKTRGKKEKPESAKAKTKRKSKRDGTKGPQQKKRQAIIREPALTVLTQRSP